MVRILLIDDNADIRVLFRRILERAGYEVLDAPDGAVGLRRSIVPSRTVEIAWKYKPHPVCCPRNKFANSPSCHCEDPGLDPRDEAIPILGMREIASGLRPRNDNQPVVKLFVGRHASLQ